MREETHGPARAARAMIVAALAIGGAGAAGMACTTQGKPSAADTSQSTPAAGGALSARRETGATSAASGGTPQIASSRRTLVILGTSLTAGLGLDPSQAYPALLQQKIDSAGLPFFVENAGLSGETSAGALRRVDWLLRGPIDVFVLETGANDGLRGLDVDSTRMNVEGVIRAVARARPGARIGLVQMEAPPNLGPRYVAAFHAIFPAAARATHATLLPFLLQGVAGRAGLNQGDGIHPNVRGEQIVAATVWSALEPLLREDLQSPTAAASVGAEVPALRRDTGTVGVDDRSGGR